MADREIFWHLPGCCYFYYLNQVTIKTMHNYPDLFREGYRIGSVYGTFPGAIWNGGRAVFGIMARSEIEQTVRTYEKLGVPLRLTWTNSLIEEKHLNDTYCNMIMKLADNGHNQVLVNTEVLEKYLRETYPNYKYISSTTKRITDPERLMQEMNGDYELVVLDYDLNHDEAVLKSLEPQAGRVELLVDEICYSHCSHRVDHYCDESKAQLEFARGTGYNCPNMSGRPSFAECKKRPQFISADEIESYADRGFVNFKLVGRGLPMSLVIDSYVYYLAREECRNEVKSKIMKILTDAVGPEMIKRMG